MAAAVAVAVAVAAVVAMHAQQVQDVRRMLPCVMGLALSISSYSRRRANRRRISLIATVASGVSQAVSIVAYFQEQHVRRVYLVET